MYYKITSVETNKVLATIEANNDQQASLVTIFLFHNYSTELTEISKEEHEKLKLL